METVIGHDTMIMVGAHVAHDCRIGNHVLLTNNATSGGMWKLVTMPTLEEWWLSINLSALVRA